MSRIIADVFDANLSGYIRTHFNSIEELQSVLDRATGSWSNELSDEGAVLLSEPYAHVYLAESHPYSTIHTLAKFDLYPDYVVTATTVEEA